MTSTVTGRPSRTTFKVNLPSSIFDRRQAEESLLSRTFPRPPPGRGARPLLHAQGQERYGAQHN
ncbi:MAG: hypothetical protein LC790_06305, partial [Actinobacteria bacterium]|nr:hypothetical protein [Actinomycetota bacterium]